MADEARVILDRLADKHELLAFDPTDPDTTQVVTVEQGGRALEVIVPLFYDLTRIGEVVAAAADGDGLRALPVRQAARRVRGTLGTAGRGHPLPGRPLPGRDRPPTYSLEGDGAMAGFGLYPPPRRTRRPASPVS